MEFFFTKDKKIIGNTQLIADTLNMNGLSEEERSKKSYNLGYNLSSVIGSVSKGLGESLTIPNILMREILPTFYYDDINTNRNSFFKPDIEKDINLFLLHILGNINFVKYVLEPLFLQENTWLFRIKYITVYHAYLGMTKLKNHIVNNHAELIDLINSIALILNTGEILFTSKFRNCMMHYDLKDDGIFAITEGSFDEEKIFFGLIEECFNGESYEQYSNRIDIFRKQMEDLITQQYDMDSVRLKEF